MAQRNRQPAEDESEQAKWLKTIGAQPLFPPNITAKDIISRFKCACSKLYEIDYTSKKITNETQLKRRCVCAYKSKFLFFCPCCNMTCETDGSILTHFLMDHCRLSRIDFWSLNRKQLLTTMMMCPFGCDVTLPCKELLPHIQQDIQRLLEDFRNNRDLSWFKCCCQNSQFQANTAFSSVSASNNHEFEGPAPTLQNVNTFQTNPLPENGGQKPERMNEIDDEQSSNREPMDVDNYSAPADFGDGREDDEVQRNGLNFENIQEQPIEIEQITAPASSGGIDSNENNEEDVASPTAGPTAEFPSNYLDSFHLGVDGLENLSQFLTFTPEIMKLKEIQELKRVIDNSNRIQHDFKIKSSKLDFSSLASDLKGDELSYFNMYLKMSDRDVRKAADLIQTTIKKANPLYSFKFTHNWFINLKERLRDKHFGKSEREETFVGLNERFGKILSSYGDLLQTDSNDPKDFVNSSCYKRLLEYCKKVKPPNQTTTSNGQNLLDANNSIDSGNTNSNNNVYPLCCLVWRDDFEEFSYSQVETTSKGGVSFRILNFPHEFQKKVQSVFLYSISQPKSQDLMTDIVDQFNMLFRGIEFDGKYYIPFFTIALCDNPERYKFLKRNWWNSKSEPCSHCNAPPSFLPFNPLVGNTDAKYLKNLNTFLPIYAKYAKEKEKLILDTNHLLSVENLRNYVREHQNFEKIIEEYRNNCGHRFIKSQPLPNDMIKHFKKLVKKKTISYFPMFTYSLDIIPFIYLQSYWKGLFPLFLSLPMEPFRTIFNIMKSTIEYLKINDQIHITKFNLFISSINNSKEENVKFSQDTKLWHGDQYLMLLEKTELWKKFCDCIKDSERENVMKLGILVSILKHCSPKDVFAAQIPEKLRVLQLFKLSDAYTKFVQKKITSHQILHLIEQIAYLGHMGNFDGQNHEKKHKKIGRKAIRLFLGGDVSQQICNFEVMKENIVLMNVQQHRIQVSFEEAHPYDEKSWFELLKEKFEDNVQRHGQ